MIKNKMKHEIRIPSDEDFNNYTGRSCFHLWNQLDNEKWQCPGCGRTKREIMRWTRIVDMTHYGFAKKYIMGWSSNLHRHHDHSQDSCLELGKGRFTETIICCDCNSADAAVKKKLQLPKNFSFSPSEIRQFVYSFAHGKHQINYNIADKIFLKYTDSKKQVGAGSISLNGKNRSESFFD